LVLAYYNINMKLVYLICLLYTAFSIKQDLADSIKDLLSNTHPVDAVDKLGTFIRYDQGQNRPLQNYYSTPQPYQYSAIPLQPIPYNNGNYNTLQYNQYSNFPQQIAQHINNDKIYFDNFRNEFVLPKHSILVLIIVIDENNVTKMRRIESILESMRFENDTRKNGFDIRDPPILKVIQSNADKANDKVSIRQPPNFLI
jgi:hypothetical protein